MKNRTFTLKNWKSCLVLIILISLLVIPQVAQANIRFDNDGELPYYARIARGEYYADGDWLAIVFYRPPACIPPDFNLLDFFDFANAWSCQPTTTSGFEIWKNGPSIDMAPIQQELHGKGAVPVWFVSMQEIQAAIVDDNLSIVELASLPSLKTGVASFYHETLHPWGGAIRNSMEFNAHGLLADGRTFKVHAEHTEANFQVNIHFAP